MFFYVITFADMTRKTVSHEDEKTLRGKRQDSIYLWDKGQAEIIDVSPIEED